jgi:hypothetical protein
MSSRLLTNILSTLKAETRGNSFQIISGFFLIEKGVFDYYSAFLYSINLFVGLGQGLAEN